MSRQKNQSEEEAKERPNAKLLGMVDEGIRVKDAVFFETVRASESGPTNELHCANLFEKGAFSKEKLARMFMTPLGLICFIGKEVTIVPEANIRYWRPL